MSTRDEVLARIRTAIGARPADAAADYASVARDYRRTGSLQRSTLLDLFTARLEHYQVTVRRSSDADVQQAIAERFAARGTRRVVIPKDVPGRWLAPGIDYLVDDGLSYESLDRSDGVLTGCTLAIALTGTIVLCHGTAEGRRALTLVPDYHVCVVRAEQVVETVPEAFQRLGGSGDRRLVTTISGPSATSDIEMTRVRGVHGPRTLDVVLLA